MNPISEKLVEEAKVAALVALAEHGSTTDIQELLVGGSPSRSFPPGALDKMIRAALEATPLAEVVSALEPFAAVADEYGDGEDDHYEVWMDAGPIPLIQSTFELRNFRRARQLLSKISGGQSCGIM